VLTGVYRGAVLVESAGQRRPVRALRQIGIGSLGRPAANPDPLVYDNADRWDLRYLGTAIDLGARLDGYSRSYTANTGAAEGRTVAGYELVLPKLVAEPEFDADDLATPRDPGEILVGAAIAVSARTGSFQERWDSVFGFRDEGAAWGLVALDQAVDDAPVLADVEQALSIASRPALVEVASGSGPGPTTGTAPTTSSPPATSGTTAGPPPTTAPPPTSPPTTPGPSDLPGLPDLPGVPGPPTVPRPQDGVVPETGIPAVDAVVAPIDAILGGLLGG
jgi:hypothetical protein